LLQSLDAVTCEPECLVAVATEEPPELPGFVVMVNFEHVQLIATGFTAAIASSELSLVVDAVELSATVLGEGCPRLCAYHFWI
jgi:hypothetical protein